MHARIRIVFLEMLFMIGMKDVLRILYFISKYLPLLCNDGVS